MAGRRGLGLQASAQRDGFGAEPLDLGEQAVAVGVQAPKGR
jgi:hypothetical protein